jgi:hypothetical protein
VYPVRTEYATNETRGQSRDNNEDLFHNFSPFTRLLYLPDNYRALVCIYNQCSSIR